ncbi:MAG: glycosyltransferase [Colwellia sp.]|nr:glycosyltransferase [Colwellia sp.]
MSKSHAYHQRPLIVFGEDWGAHPSSTQHIVKVLGKTRAIIWCNSIGLRKPKLTFHDVLRIYNKIKSFLFNKDKKQDNIPHDIDNFMVINPLVIPCADSWLSLKISKFILKHQLRSACKKLTITDPIIWTSLPTSVDYLDIFEGAPCVYYCGDDFANLTGVDHHLVTKKETELIEKSNYIFTASEKLQYKFPCEKVVNIPHGVNYSLFSKQADLLPDDLPQGKPIAGFYGSISTWLDQQLLVQTITALPHWNFVFIGDIDCNVDRLQKFSNVHFLGSKIHSELPEYIQNWNVAILPFVDNKQIQMCNPLKLREYLASGTPIVSTNFNALKNYRQYIQIADLDKPFHQAILFANAEITSSVNFDNIENINDLLQLTELRDTRKASVKNESWEKRANEIHQYLLMC